MLTVPQNLSSGIIKPSSKFWIYLDAFCLLFFLGRTVSTSVRSSIFVGKIIFFKKKIRLCYVFSIILLQKIEIDYIDILKKIDGWAMGVSEYI